MAGVEICQSRLTAGTSSMDSWSIFCQPKITNYYSELSQAHLSQCSATPQLPYVSIDGWPSFMQIGSAAAHCPLRMDERTLRGCMRPAPTSLRGRWLNLIVQPGHACRRRKGASPISFSNMIVQSDKLPQHSSRGASAIHSCIGRLNPQICDVAVH